MLSKSQNKKTNIKKAPFPLQVQVLDERESGFSAFALRSHGLALDTIRILNFIKGLKCKLYNLLWITI